MRACVCRCRTMPTCAGARVPACAGARVPACAGVRVPACDSDSGSGCQCGVIRSLPGPPTSPPDSESPRTLTAHHSRLVLTAHRRLAHSTSQACTSNCNSHAELQRNLCGLINDIHNCLAAGPDSARECSGAESRVFARRFKST